jgi:hypothetical protein
MGNKLFKSKEKHDNDVLLYKDCVKYIECDIEQETFTKIIKGIKYEFYYKIKENELNMV